jgi:hypothetical protein
MLLRLILSLAVLANPAAFPCQYFVIEMDAAECASRLSECPTPPAQSSCCGCCGDDSGECSPTAETCPPATCETDGEQATGDEAPFCRCCIRVSPDPRVPVKVKARVGKTRLSPLPRQHPGVDIDRASLAAGLRADLRDAPEWSGTTCRPPQALLCIWLK